MSDGGFSNENVSNSPQKGKSGDMHGSGGMLRGANGVSSSVTSGQASFNFKDSHVKFNIKLFRVPELYIEVPETATVGSLKRTVMEAVTAIFKGELQLGSPGTSVLDSGMPDALLEPPLPVDLLGVSIFCTSLWTAYKLGEKDRIRKEKLL